MLADFGLAKIKKEASPTQSQHKGKSTVRWTAPEVLSGGIHSTASDVFSFGVFLCGASCL